jgi:hypothetical protein
MQVGEGAAETGPPIDFGERGLAEVVFRSALAATSRALCYSLPLFKGIQTVSF